MSILIVIMCIAPACHDMYCNGKACWLINSVFTIVFYHWHCHFCGFRLHLIWFLTRIWWESRLGPLPVSLFALSCLEILCNTSNDVTVTAVVQCMLIHSFWVKSISCRKYFIKYIIGPFFEKSVDNTSIMFLLLQLDKQYEQSKYQCQMI